MDAALKTAIREGSQGSPTPGIAYSCFAKDWDPRAPECAGGIDYAKSPSPRHEKCPYFDHVNYNCGKEKAADLAARPQPIPISSLTRPPVGGPTLPAIRVAPSSPVAPASPERPYANLAALATRAVNGAAMTQPQPQPAPVVPQQQVLVPAQAPHVQYIAQDNRMPQYLTEPEPIFEDESVWPALGFELLRGGIKGLLHTGASFVDRYAFRRRRQ